MNPDFDWDDANVRHIALHGITPLEVEQSTLDEKAVLLELQSVKDEERVQLVGMTPAGRCFYHAGRGDSSGHFLSRHQNATVGILEAMEV